jgi:glucosamine-6-phosphate deaminase
VARRAGRRRQIETDSRHGPRTRRSVAIWRTPWHGARRRGAHEVWTVAAERVPVKLYGDEVEASIAVAGRIAALIRRRAAEGSRAVLGLATGHTPIYVYRELIRMHEKEGLDFANVVTFNLDEYWPMAPDGLQSYRRWMFESFFDHVNVPRHAIHIPDGTVPEAEVDAFCRRYEQAITDAGGIDLQILGIGRTGHVGFNESGSAQTSRTRLIHLDRVTRMDAASDFFGVENVPRHAITMGVATIMAARSICLLAFGEHKAPIVRRAVEEPISPQVAASHLQDHRDATLYLGGAAASMLTRVATPWLLGPCTWDETLARRAVLWLALKLAKTILELTDEDYAENHLYELLRQRGGAYNLNLEVFHRMMNTITGWPGGKEGRRKVLIFSPHPDDDVISMGATLQRLVKQGHAVHVAYQTSGNIAVFDHAVLRYADFVRGFNDVFGIDAAQIARIDAHIEQFLRNKRPATPDSEEVQAVKTLIRRTEAIHAAAHCGVSRGNCHFLDMPFYRTGTVRKLPLAPEDFDLVRRILFEVRPDIVFAAGDLSDPHGTHRMCLDAVLPVLAQYGAETGAGVVTWLYRGAWQEWEPYEIDMAVPISPDERYDKRHAIFRHESQKDRAMFPGPYDAREFWQRAEERNRSTAAVYDKLGLPQYHGIEAFVRWRQTGTAASRGGP